MKLSAIATLLFIASLAGTAHAQRRASTMQPGPVSIADSFSRITYLLDEAHMHITALTFSGDTLWVTDPWKDNHVGLHYTHDHRFPWNREATFDGITRPVIVFFGITLPGYNNPDRSRLVSIRYDNTLAGELDRNGVFRFMYDDFR